jgi:SpoVK/Ycf46/Vps4 family AAA+-type ATPase
VPRTPIYFTVIFLQHPNVLVMTTSNITDAIDLAFVDRADIKQYIGPPGPRVRYDILRTCLDELMRVGIVTPFIQLQSSLDAQRAHEKASSLSNEDSTAAVSLKLYACAVAADGFSGRALRKLPFLAHTLCASNAEVGPSQVLMYFFLCVNHYMH